MTIGVLLVLLGLGSLVVPSPVAARTGEFCNNVKVVTASLPNKTSSSPVLFATDIVGQAPDVLYAVAMCRPDVNGTSCSNCLAYCFSQAFLNSTTCYSTYIIYTSTFAYGDYCRLFYSNDSGILAPYNNTSDDTPYEVWSGNNVTGSDVPLVAGLIRELLAKTVERAAQETPTRFATGVMDSGTNSPTVYSMAQCMPDMSAGDCRACLRRLLGTVNSTMFYRMGGRLHFTRCYFRYEAYPFDSSNPMVSVLPPAPAPPSPITPIQPHTRRTSKLWVIPTVAVPLAAIALVCFILYSRRSKRQRTAKGMRSQALRWAQDLERDKALVWQGKNSEFSIFDFQQILEATDNFSEENKLGKGGFGVVYRGRFRDGTEVAVKRLASHSGQGFVEFKNEVQLIAKLQHTNLVRLLGCCSQDEEKILVYEYLPNKSLDFFIFDENKRAILDWSKLLAIIQGIAHGLLYLHKHSRLRVIHRDLKPSNILLDSEMNPKISDFGLAKIFSSNSSEGNTTRRVVGTYGYMAPEYASEGIFSIKSDVFSFGVIMLEIFSGKRNSGTQQCGEFINLLGYAWQLWEEERWTDLVDESLLPKSHSPEMIRCINIALLCVQENAADRPTMAEVVAMLRSETTVMDKPKQPAYFNVRVGNDEATATESSSINYMTISVATPR